MEVSKMGLWWGLGTLLLSIGQLTVTPKDLGNGFLECGVATPLSLLASSPVPITAGGDYLDGRIYFASGSRLYSFRVAE